MTTANRSATADGTTETAAAFSPGAQQQAARAAAFEVWSHRGVKFVAVPTDRSHHIMDENGNQYGAWLDLARFRKAQKFDLTEAMPIGKAALSVRTVCLP